MQPIVIPLRSNGRGSFVVDTLPTAPPTKSLHIIRKDVKVCEDVASPSATYGDAEGASGPQGCEAAVDASGGLVGAEGTLETAFSIGNAARRVNQPEGTDEGHAQQEITDAWAAVQKALGNLFRGGDTTSGAEALRGDDEGHAAKDAQKEPLDEKDVAEDDLAKQPSQEKKEEVLLPDVTAMDSWSIDLPDWEERSQKSASVITDSSPTSAGGQDHDLVIFPGDGAYPGMQDNIIPEFLEKVEKQASCASPVAALSTAVSITATSDEDGSESALLRAISRGSSRGRRIERTVSDISVTSDLLPDRLSKLSVHEKDSEAGSQTPSALRKARESTSFDSEDAEASRPTESIDVTVPKQDVEDCTDTSGDESVAGFACRAADSQELFKATRRKRDFIKEISSREMTIKKMKIRLSAKAEELCQLEELSHGRNSVFCVGDEEEDCLRRDPPAMDVMPTKSCLKQESPCTNSEEALNWWEALFGTPVRETSEQETPQNRKTVRFDCDQDDACTSPRRSRVQSGLLDPRKISGGSIPSDDARKRSSLASSTGLAEVVVVPLALASKKSDGHAGPARDHKALA